MPIFAPASQDEARERVIEVLTGVMDPELRRSLPELGMVGDIKWREPELSVELKLTIAACPAADRIRTEAARAIEQGLGVPPTIELTTMTPEERTALKAKLLAGKPARLNRFAEPDSLTQVVLITSGKGGVGKSTITSNLAAILAKRGLDVGVLDADVFGHSIPGQFGITAGPTRVDELMLPPIAHDVKVISIGMFTNSNEPVAWRGPLLHRAIEQFLSEVYWGALDVLLVDLPPGTGDIAISLGQLLPSAQVVVVTTPQLAAATVAERSGAIAKKLGQRVIGVIENLSYFTQQDGSRVELYGSGGGAAVAAALAEPDSSAKIQVLARLPFSLVLREGADEGTPAAISHPQDPAVTELNSVADSIRAAADAIIGKKLPLHLA
jgi:ATP-binding protein involved in chromosome partitioning